MVVVQARNKVAWIGWWQWQRGEGSDLKYHWKTKLTEFANGSEVVG